MNVSPLSCNRNIDPQVRAFIVRTGADYAALAAVAPPTTLARRREIAEQVRAPWARGGPDMSATHMIRIGPDGVRARLHIPQGGPGKGILLYLHGGGWTLFSIDTHDRLMREYADRIGCAVIGLDYSLSPEHRFPKALDEVETCIGWLRKNAETYGLSADRIAIGGDSAGGNLSLATALRLRDRGQTLPAALLLNYAALDTEARPSYEVYDGDPYMLNVEEMRDFWLDYLGTPDTDDPYARPLLADLSGLPPVHLCIAECDILADQNRELADRLESAGVEVSAIVYEGATHSFLEAVSISDCADRAIQDASEWLYRILNA
ncbi:MAG: alpha/beta hydrolase [Hyphomonas sp.]